MATIDFWFDYASTYSYLSAMRIEAIAREAGVDVRWRPFLLGPIFKAQGWTSSPFNLYPAKGRYMIRDMERICEERGLAFRMPDPFPANSLHAARVGVVAAQEGWIAPYTRAIYVAQFAQGRDISADETLTDAIVAAGQDGARALAASRDEQAKSLLRQETEIAAKSGIFGAPSFVVEGELFWGDDRLEQALARARRNE